MDIWELLREIERRKLAQEDLCDPCFATGQYDGAVCFDCLGQGVLLTPLEYDRLIEIARADDDDHMLDAAILE